VLKEEMMAAAGAHEFETAAKIRDKIYALEKTVEKQIAVTTDFMDRDVIGIARNDFFSVIVVMMIRKGFLQGVRQFDFKDAITTDHDVMDAFFKQYYKDADYIPGEILLPFPLEDAHIYHQWLSSHKNASVRILVPQRGAKFRLTTMARENAESRLTKMVDEVTSKADLLNRLQLKLKSQNLPVRIECIDNSGMMGRNLVSGIVVFVDGKPAKKLYRRYNIVSTDRQDDYGSMKEALSRRFKNQTNSQDLPDLLIVDGGRGQLNIALDVLKKMDLIYRFDVIGIAKKDCMKNEPHDKIYKPGRVNPVNFGKDIDLLYFLQQIRDEAHRFAITFHRKKRTKTALHSRLDAIAGIGRKRKAALLKKFASIKKLQEASVDEIAGVPGISLNVARTVYDAIRDNDLQQK
jgi:excinuclease ABC subunit C